DLAGGWLTDWLARTHGLRVARCGLGFAAFFTCAALVFASTVVGAPVAKAVLLALALASADLALGACWAVPVDVAVNHAGVVTGFMNTFGNLGGLVGPIVIGVAVDRWHSWTFPFYVTAIVYAAGAMAWLTIDPNAPIGRATAPTYPSFRATTATSPGSRRSAPYDRRIVTRNPIVVSAMAIPSRS